MDPIHVQIQYFGQAKRVAGCTAEDVSLPEGSTLSDLVHEVTARHGTRLEQLLIDQGELRSEVALLVNGSNALLQGGLATPLKEEDKAMIVILVSPLTGG